MRPSPGKGLLGKLKNRIWQTNTKTQKKKEREKEIKAQRTPTCFIPEGSFTIHIVVSWITLHQTITLLAKKAPDVVICVRLNFVRKNATG